jgi:hypothetical protein
MSWYIYIYNKREKEPKIMAKVMYFSDDRSVEYTASYWKVASYNVSVDGRNMNVTFTGYKDKAARDARKTPIGGKSYSIDAEQFDNVYDDILSKKSNPVELFYKLATNTKDTRVGRNPDDSLITQSFFHTAVDV